MNQPQEAMPKPPTAPVIPTAIADAAQGALEGAYLHGFLAGKRAGREEIAAFLQHRAGALRRSGKHAAADELVQISVDALSAPSA